MSKKRKNIQSEISAKTDTPKKKNKHKKILIGIFGCLLLMLVAVGLYLFIPRQQEPVATEELVDCPLYWNVDREKYQPKLGGLSTRQPDADGFYTMRFLTRGEIVEYRVKDKELMLTIDSEDAMGLLVDEDGFVTEYVELIDMGVREVASWYYVLRPKEDGAIINTSTVGKGVNIDIKWQDETGFWDVTNKEDYGCATKLELLDAVRVFNNSDGEITDVFVVEREPSLAGLSPDQYCPHCGKVVTWTMWAFLDSFPSGEGHYWVVHDINMKKQYSMPKDTKQCVNLNGKTITATHEKRMVSLHNEGVELAIMDLSEEQTGTLKGKGDGGMGSVVWVRFGQFDLYGGTLDASEVVTYSAGAAVNVFNKDGVFNMHDGTIIGGTVKAIVNEKGNVTNATGGALAVRGTVNMYGGTIRDGKCVTTKDKAGNKGASAGGNVFVYNGGTFNMYDGVISGGTIADNQVAYGGNVRVVPGAVWNMYGGVIENGVSFNKAGNFSLFGTLNMSGGVIRGGKVMTDGESLKDAKVDEDSASKNLHIDSGKLNMTGGTIEGYVNVAGKKSELNISGTAKIAGGKSNLTLPTTNVINMGQLKKGAKIGISGGGFITNETKESNCQYVFSDYGLNVSYEENKMLIGKYACICGEQSGKHFGKCDGTKLAWAPWVNEEVAPSSTGNWYLLTDVNLKKSYTLGKDTQMNLDLNGFSICGEAGENGARVYSLRNENVKMQLTDHSKDKTGSIVAQGTGEKVGYGNCIWVAMDSELHMYGGCLDASVVKSTVGGVAVQVQKGCKFYMYDGSIKGGTTDGSGGAVSVDGQFEMYGGTVTGGKAKGYGGNVYATKAGVFKLYGGEIRDGEAATYGGNVGSDKYAYIYGGVLNGGTAQAGGNLYAKQSITIENATIKEGTADYGGNINATQDVKLTIINSTISKGVAKISQGGNIRVLAGSETVIENSTICDGEAGTLGGNIYMNGGTLTMEGSAITGGTVAEGFGANVYVNRQKMGNKEENATLNLNSGSIDGEIYLAKGDAHTLNLADDIQIGLAGSDASKPYGISWTGNVIINGNKVNEDAKVVLDTIGSLEVTGTGDERAFSILDKEAAKRNKITDDSNGDGIGNLSIAATMCVCGKIDGRFDHTEGCGQPEGAWQPWTSTTTLPTTEGNYYLTADVNVTGTRHDITGGAKVNLDLAGFTVTGADTTCQLYRLQNGTLNIADSSDAKTGTMKAIGTSNMDAQPGRVLYVWGAGTGGKTSYANIFGGTFDASEAKGGYGTAITISKGSVTMYDGTVIAGSVVEGHANSVEIGIADGTTSILDVKGGNIHGEVLLGNNTAELKISNDAKVGIADANGTKAYGIGTTSLVTTTRTVACTDVSANGAVVLKDLNNLDVSGTGEGSAFTILNTTFRNKITDDKADGIGKLSTAYMCVCGKADGKYDHTDSCKQPESAWKPWTSTTALPTSAGSYYLTQNMVGVATRSQLDNVNAMINLDLAGYTIEGSGNAGMFYRVQAGTFNIADSSTEQTGAIKMTGTTNTYGSIAVWGANSESTYINIFGGTYSATTGTVATLRRGHLNMYGGTILPGAKAEDYAYANAVQVGIGNNKLTDLKVFGGTIKGEVLINDHTGATITVANDAKVGIKDDNQPEKPYGIGTTDAVTSVQTINFDKANGQIVLKTLNDKGLLEVAGTGEGSAFTVLDSRNKVADDNANGIGNLVYEAYMCVCGKADGKYDHTDGCQQPESVWQPWTDTTVLPSAAGSYYLTRNMTDVKARGQLAAQGKAVNLDLAGYKVEGPGTSDGMLYRVQTGTLNIADSSKEQTGAITHTGTANIYGAVRAWGGTNALTYINIFGGTISANAGTTVTVRQGHINMYGGTILPGTKVEFSGLNFTGANAVQVGILNNVKADLNVYGGTIKGEVLIGPNEKIEEIVNIFNNAKVGIADGTKAYGIGITENVTSAQTITCNKVTANASVVLKNSHDVTVSGTGEGSAFSIIDPHNKVVDDNANGIGNLSIVAQMCVCGAVGEHTKVGDCSVPTSAWLPWNEALSTATYSKVQMPSTSFSYYLIDDMTKVAQVSLASQRLSIDLAGHTVDGSDTANRIFIVQGTAKLNITDSVGGGTIKNASTTAGDVYNGKVIRIWNSTSASVNLFAGTLTAKGTNISAETDGAASTVLVNKGTFNMYGGTIVGDGNSSDTFEAVEVSGNGTFNNIGGTVME